MFTQQGENENLKKGKIISKDDVVDNKKVIAEYDEVLSLENDNQESHLSKLELLKQKLGLSGEGKTSDIKTNLIDNDDVATFIDWKSSLNIFISYFLVFLVLLSGTFAYLTFLEKEKEKKVGIYDEDIQRTREQILIEEEKASDGLLFQKKIDALADVLDKHIYWSNLFAYIEKNTLEDINYDGFSGKLDGKYSLSGLADKSYFTAAEQIKLFKEDKLTDNAEVLELSLSKTDDIEKINFNLNLSVDPEIFYKKNK